MIQLDPSYYRYMSGLLTNPHIKIKCKKDMRARGYARMRLSLRSVASQTTFFLFSFFLSLHLHQSHENDLIYK